MKEVLQPLNDKAANAIVDHIDLIEASSVDPLLLKLVAYVKTVRVMMSRYVPHSLQHVSLYPSSGGHCRKLCYGSSRRSVFGVRPSGALFL